MLFLIDEDKPVASPRKRRVDLFEANRTLRVYCEAVDRLEIILRTEAICDISDSSGEQLNPGVDSSTEANDLQGPIKDSH